MTAHTALHQLVADLSDAEATALLPVLRALVDGAPAASERKRLPTRRRGFTTKARVGGTKLLVMTGEYPDGSLGEVWVELHKEGAPFRSLLSCFAMAISIGLQHGVPLASFLHTFEGVRFEPLGDVVGHDSLKEATSIVDYLIRHLAAAYLPGTAGK